MEKIKINYTSNKQLWKIERIAAEHGYTKTSDCYWAQIFSAEDGSEIITSREETASDDPAAELIASLDAKQETAKPSAPAAPVRLTVEQFGGVQLPHRVAVYVPSTQGPAENTDNSEQVQRVARELAEMFGGATATTARGFWVSDSAGLVAEAVTIVYASCTDRQYHEQVPDVIRIAQRIKQEMQQEAVSIELDGILYIV